MHRCSKRGHVGVMVGVLVWKLGGQASSGCFYLVCVFFRHKPKISCLFNSLRRAALSWFRLGRDSNIFRSFRPSVKTGILLTISLWTNAAHFQMERSIVLCMNLRSGSPGCETMGMSTKWVGYEKCLSYCGLVVLRVIVLMNRHHWYRDLCWNYPKMYETQIGTLGI